MRNTGKVYGAIYLSPLESSVSAPRSRGARFHGIRIDYRKEKVGVNSSLDRLKSMAIHLLAWDPAAITPRNAETSVRRDAKRQSRRRVQSRREQKRKMEE